MEGAVHQAGATPLHNLNDIVIERCDEVVEVVSCGETILDGCPRWYRDPLLKGRIVDQFQEGIVEIDRCTTSPIRGEQPSGVNEAVPESDVSEKPRGGPWRVDGPGELRIR